MPISKTEVERRYVLRNARLLILDRVPLDEEAGRMTAMR
jgi:hypothetical protein